MHQKLNLTCRPATPSDAVSIKLRDEDRAEAALVPGDPAANFRAVMKVSPTRLSFLNAEGAVVCIFGVACIEGRDELFPWLLNSDLAEEHEEELLHVLRLALQPARDAGQPLGMFIGKGSERNRAFVQHLGFVIVPSPTGDFDFFYLPNV